MNRILPVALFAVLMPSAAFADDAAPGAPASPICTDRPTKATSACTVPEGSFQLETDLVNWTRNSDGGTRTDTIFYTNPTLKYGVTGSTDIEANIAPYVTVRTHDSGGSNTIGGVGDLYLRIKQRLTASDAKALFAIEPYVKVPTAKNGIGNGKVEGGVVGTGVFTLPDGFTLTVSPEVDALIDGDLHGRHAQVVGAFNIGKTLSSKLTAYAELWTSQNYDPAGTIRQYSADAAFAYVVRSTLQFDAGVNVGLNRYTPDVQAYAGVSTRF